MLHCFRAKAKSKCKAETMQLRALFPFMCPSIVSVMEQNSMSSEVTLVL